MFTDRKPRELLKQYSRISIVDGTSFQANLNRQQSVKNFNNTGLSLQRGLSKKELINALNRENTEENQGKDVGFIMMRESVQYLTIGLIHVYASYTYRQAISELHRNMWLPLHFLFYAVQLCTWSNVGIIIV